MSDYEVAIRDLEAHSAPIRMVKEAATVLPGIRPEITQKFEDIANLVYHL